MKERSQSVCWCAEDGYAIICVMFIRLTRTDGLPVWLNASFIVTVEPARSGGSIVVPIGDGLDYDVKEPPETVLALLDAAPPAKVVPVPPPKALTPMPDDLSPEIGFRSSDAEEAKPDALPETEKTKPVAKKRTRRVKSTAAKVEKTGRVDESQPPQETASAEKTAESAPSAADRPLPVDFDRIVADLKTRKCRTAKRMRNAIKGFFGKTDETEIDAILEAMLNRGYILIGTDGHVEWTA